MNGIVEGEEELGSQKRCPACGEWWPVDPEFWYVYRHGPRTGLANSPCRACFADKSAREWAARKATRPA